MSFFLVKYGRVVLTVLCMCVAVSFFLPARTVQSHVTFLAVDKLPQEEQQVLVNPTEETDMENYKRPSYFSIFKFIISFLPGTQR